MTTPLEQLALTIEALKAQADHGFSEDLPTEELEDLLNQADLAEADRDRIVAKMIQANRDAQVFIDGKRAAIERDRMAIKSLEEQIERREESLRSLLRNVDGRKIYNPELGLNLHLRLGSGEPRVEGLKSVKPSDLDTYYLRQIYVIDADKVREGLKDGAIVHPLLGLVPRKDSLIIK